VEWPISTLWGVESNSEWPFEGVGYGENNSEWSSA